MRFRATEVVLITSGKNLNLIQYCPVSVSTPFLATCPIMGINNTAFPSNPYSLFCMYVVYIILYSFKRFSKFLIELNSKTNSLLSLYRLSFLSQSGRVWAPGRLQRLQAMTEPKTSDARKWVLTLVDASKQRLLTHVTFSSTIVR